MNIAVFSSWLFLMPCFRLQTIVLVLPLTTRPILRLELGSGLGLGSCTICSFYRSVAPTKKSLRQQCSFYFISTEIADACVFLASEKSSFITGVALEVTGMFRTVSPPTSSSLCCLPISFPPLLPLRSFCVSGGFRGKELYYWCFPGGDSMFETVSPPTSSSLCCLPS